jgi:hypothetical protein
MTVLKGKATMVAAKVHPITIRKEATSTKAKRVPLSKILTRTKAKPTTMPIIVPRSN